MTTWQEFRQAIKDQESSDNYAARNSESGALGAYQVMPQNLLGTWGGRAEQKGFGWDFDALGRDVTPEEFAASPQLQDAVAEAKLKPLFEKYGPEKAAQIWFAGPEAEAKIDKKSPYDNQTARKYSQEVLARLGGDEAGSMLPDIKPITGNVDNTADFLSQNLDTSSLIANDNGEIPVVRGLNGPAAPTTKREASIFSEIAKSGLAPGIEPHYVQAATAIAAAADGMNGASMMADSGLVQGILEIMDVL